MNLNELRITSITKIIAHQIKPKTPKIDAHSINTNELLVLKPEEDSILIERLETAICNHSKSFELSYDDKSEQSIYNLLHINFPSSDNDFISSSQQIAEKLASSHFRTKIPGGYCLVGEALLNAKKKMYFIVKAELQAVFNIDQNRLNLIKNVFLSPAKDFYKVGFFIEHGKSYTPYMFDDQFTMQKRDLTEYFYSQFLGLTTDKNDVLKSKNFFNDTKLFIDENIDNLQDKIGLQKALTVLFRENVHGTISLRQFADDHMEGKLKENYLKQFLTKYPRAFTKRTDLIDKKIELDRVSIPLTYSMTLIGNKRGMKNVQIISDITENTKHDLIVQINSGNIRQMVIVKEAADETEEPKQL
jgi:hypothetical protein